MPSRPLSRLALACCLISSTAAAQSDNAQACRPLTAATLQQSSLQQARDRWDWVSQSSLPAALHCHFETGCRGMYIEPVRNWVDADSDPLLAPLHASADYSRIDGDTVSFGGNVELRKGNLSLDAGEAEFRRDQHRLSLKDGVVLRQPGLMLSGSTAEIDTNTGLGHIEQARFVSYTAGARAEAGHIQRHQPQQLRLDAATYTQCPPDNESWSLKASRIDLDYASGRGVARHSRLHVGSVPVFYIPWMDFPVDDRRATGLLWPSIGSNDGGLDIAVPYYFNLAPHYDMTLTPRFLEQRGEMLESELRYLNRFSSWKLGAAYLGNDKEDNTDRWLGNLDEKGVIADRWQTRIDYTRVSDIDYFRDLGISSLSVRRSTHLNQLASLQYSGDHFSSRLQLHQFQTIAAVDEPYRKVPQWSFNYLPGADNFRLQPIFDLDITRFDHPDSFADGGSTITGNRAYSAAGLRLPMHWQAGFIIPSVKLRHVNYELDTGASDNSPETTVGTGSLDMGLFFERSFERSNSHWLQTLEPRLFYLYSEYQANQDAQPDFDTTALDLSYQQLFRESRFTGYDRLDDANQIALGLRSRFINRSEQREVLSLAMGQLFYLDDREVQLSGDPVETESNSEIATELRYAPHPRAWLSSDMLWDSRRNHINQQQLGAHYRTTNNSLYNLGYSLRRNQWQDGAIAEPVEQADASLAIPIGSQWQWFMRWQYDIRSNNSLENLAGFAFQNCCWMARVVYQRSVEPDDSSGVTTLNTDEAILLEFQLKGLGGIGNKLTDVLKESIFGYRDND